MAKTNKKANKAVKKSTPVKSSKAAVKVKAKKVIKPVKAAISKGKGKSAKIKAKSKTTTKTVLKPVSKAKSTVKANSKLQSFASSKASIPKASAKSRTGQVGKQKSAALYLQPLHDRVVVERMIESEVTAGGIIIPLTAMEKPLKGLILAVGSGQRDKKGRIRPLDVQVGEYVLFGKYAGSEVNIDGHEMLVLKEEDILGVVAE